MKPQGRKQIFHSTTNCEVPGHAMDDGNTVEHTLIHTVLETFAVVVLAVCTLIYMLSGHFLHYYYDPLQQ